MNCSDESAISAENRCSKLGKETFVDRVVKKASDHMSVILFSPEKKTFFHFFLAYTYY